MGSWGQIPNQQQHAALALETMPCPGSESLCKAGVKPSPLVLAIAIDFIVIVVIAIIVDIIVVIIFIVVAFVIIIVVIIVINIVTNIAIIIFIVALQLS